MLIDFVFFSLLFICCHLYLFYTAH